MLLTCAFLVLPTASSSVLLTLESCRSPARMPNGAASTPPQRPLPPIPSQQREITGPQPVDVSWAASAAAESPGCRLLRVPWLSRVPGYRAFVES